MIVRHMFPSENWVKMDKALAIDATLSDGAYRLYGYLSGLRNGADFNDNYIMHGLGVTKNTLAKRKRELTKLGLILVDQIRPRQYVIYIGHSRCPALKVKKMWEAEDVHYNIEGQRVSYEEDTRKVANT